MWLQTWCQGESAKSQQSFPVEQPSQGCKEVTPDEEELNTTWLKDAEGASLFQRGETIR